MLIGELKALIENIPDDFEIRQLKEGISYNFNIEQTAIEKETRYFLISTDMD